MDLLLCRCLKGSWIKAENILMRIMVLLIVILVAGGCQTTAWDGSGQFPERHMQPASSYSVSGQSEIVVVYIGADNCPPCWRFKEDDYPGWIKSDEYRQVTYRELQFARYQATSSDTVWPDDLKWLRKATYSRRGAPRWIVLVDGKIISNEKSWFRSTHPLIRTLVARKLDS